MKYFLMLALCIGATFAFAQQLQLHYDFRHSVDPKHSAKNVPTLYFEYFKGGDFGSFLFKIQSDFTGEKYNIGQTFLQVSQSFRYWKPKVQLYLGYNAGLGIAEPDKFGYYINHTFLGGVSYPFQGKNAYFSAYLAYRHSPYNKTSHDAQLGFWWGAFSANYKFNFTGNVIVWTENKNHGDAYTANFSGKRFYLYCDPQIWYGLHQKIAIGSKMTLAYHVFTYENRFTAYPTLGVKYQL